MEPLPAAHSDRATVLRVLLVEDSTIAASAVESHLHEGTSSEVIVTHAATLQEGLELASNPYDVVLLDLSLPDGDGLPVVERLHARAPSLPIVVLTGTDDKKLAMRALDAGAQDYLLKHKLDGDALHRAIRYAIGRQQTKARLQRAVADAYASEAKLRQLLARSSDGILVLDDDRRVLYANPAAEGLLGRGDEDLRQTAGLPLSLEKAGEAEIVRGSDRIAVDIRIVDVEWEGRRARMALLRDVSERRRAQELRLQLERSERLAAVGQLAAGVAHEINNPLTYLYVNLDVVTHGIAALRESGSDTGTLSERLEDARDGVRRVARIVRDLSEFASDRGEETLRHVDVRRAVGSALSMASTEIKHRARVVETLLSVPCVMAHEGRLAQLFINLLVNAAHAIEEGRVAKNKILVRTFPSEDRYHVIVEIEDTGSGIAEEHLARIFEPFFTTKTPGKGSGLGLYICQSIAASYGGAIEVETALGKGTLFRVRLPASAEQPPAGASDVAEVPPGRPRRACVLIVDDEPRILMALTAIISPYHEIAVARSGDEAKRVIAEREGRTLDVVLCDVVMNDGNGADLYRWMEERAPGLRDRVLFMSAGAVSAQSAEFLARHRTRWLEKPFTGDQVLARIEELLSEVES